MLATVVVAAALGPVAATSATADDSPTRTATSTTGSTSKSGTTGPKGSTSTTSAPSPAVPGETPRDVQGPPPARAVDPAPAPAAASDDGRSASGANRLSAAREWIVLCTGFSGCNAAGRGNAGYESVYRQSFWSQYSGHNCTNYVAYRLIRNGMSATRPAGAKGYARDWGVNMASQTNDTPAVGSVAWWDTSFSSSGHVAYVEQVISNDQVIISEDNWGGDFRWRTVSRDGGRWPQGFIHLKDVAAGAPAPVATYKPVVTSRLLDTRTANGVSTRTPVGAGGEVSVQVAGRGGLPTTGVGSALINISVVSPSASGYVTTYPSGYSRPTARSVSYPYGTSTSSSFVSRVGSDGRIRLYTSAGAHLTVDVVGWYPNGSSLSTIVPKRLLDTRNGTNVTKGRLPDRGRVDVQVAGTSGVPSTGVASVVLGVSAENTSRGGWLTAWPAGSSRPVTTHVFAEPGRASTSTVVTRVGSTGKVSIDTEASTDLMVDVLGWFPTGADYAAVTPSRLLDTRTGVGGYSGRVPAGGVVKFQAAGRGGVPSSGVKAVSVTVTTLASTAGGALTVYPSTWSRPGVGNVLFAGGRTVVNAAVLPVASDGTIAVWSSVPSYVVVDIQGWVRS
ncbi:CHAP domain-containing protein [Terracoccus luteus]|uniref:CHAP domain-containing protein n=1 Tax=Terracoccus luteus TaxID=53356 RepID=A0A495XT13_9MICO|nr:CHAP domain-containing protein [Terracoccus luteus]RKT77661.1 CHAP domain-containing protein [Terracoccus luteus]